MHHQIHRPQLMLVAVATLFVRGLTTSPTAPATIHTGALTLRLLALTVEDGKERYRVATRDKDSWQCGTLSHAAGDKWTLVVNDDAASIELGSPDAVFSTAMGGAFSNDLRAAAPHWPEKLLGNLGRRQISGSGTIAFDTNTFLELCATSPVDHPLVLPDAASKLDLAGLQRASSLMSSLSLIHI